MPLALSHLFQPLEMHYSTFANWQLPPHIAERMAIGHNDQKILHQVRISFFYKERDTHILAYTQALMQVSLRVLSYTHAHDL